MFTLLQSFVLNGRFLARKSAVLLLLACALLVAEGCSKKIPCPEVASETKKSKKKKKAKEVKLTAGALAATAEGDATETAAEDTETASASVEDESADGAVRKAPVSGAKNRYSKNGLLRKNKYKRLRSNPNKKVMRSKRGGSGKSKTKIKQNNVGPIAE